MRKLSVLFIVAAAFSVSSCALFGGKTVESNPVVFPVPTKTPLPAPPMAYTPPTYAAQQVVSTNQQVYGPARQYQSPPMVERPPSILKDTDKFGTKYMAEDMGVNIRGKGGAPMSVVITTFVDLNDLARTSVLGRILAEKMIDEMNRQGFTVVELRRAQDVFVKKDGGEFILTRDVAELSKTTSASALLAGTYLATANTIIINARLMDIKTPRVLATVSYEMNKTDEIEGMLKGSNP